MRTMLAIAAGGACGALLRFWVTQGTHAVFGRGFPLGTLAVNVVGSHDIAPEWRAALVIGFLGAFTTFSAFSMDTLLLVHQSEHIKAGANVALSVVLCLAGCRLGMAAARQL